MRTAARRHRAARLQRWPTMATDESQLSMRMQMNELSNWLFDTDARLLPCASRIPIMYAGQRRR